MYLIFFLQTFTSCFIFWLENLSCHHFIIINFLLGASWLFWKSIKSISVVKPLFLTFELVSKQWVRMMQNCLNTHDTQQTSSMDYIKVFRIDIFCWYNIWLLLQAQTHGIFYTFQQIPRLKTLFYFFDFCFLKRYIIIYMFNSCTNNYLICFELTTYSTIIMDSRVHRVLFLSKQEDAISCYI